MQKHADPVSLLHVVLGDVPHGYQSAGGFATNDMTMVDYQGYLPGAPGTNTISLTAATPGSDFPPSFYQVTGNTTTVRVNGESGRLVIDSSGEYQQPNATGGASGSQSADLGLTQAELTWQGGAGRTITLTDSFEPGTDVSKQMVALADSVTVRAQAVAQPFYFSHLPSGLGYLGANNEEGAGVNQGGASYGINFGEGLSAKVAFELFYPLSLNEFLTPGALETSGSPNGQSQPEDSSGEPVVGSPVPTDNNTGLCENLAGGWQLCVSVTGPMPADVAAQGGLTGLLSDVTVLDVNQPQSFTTDVIR